MLGWWSPAKVQPYSSSTAIYKFQSGWTILKLKDLKFDHEEQGVKHCNNLSYDIYTRYKGKDLCHQRPMPSDGVWKMLWQYVWMMRRKCQFALEKPVTLIPAKAIIWLSIVPVCYKVTLHQWRIQEVGLGDRQWGWVHTEYIQSSIGWHAMQDNNLMGMNTVLGNTVRAQPIHLTPNTHSIVYSFKIEWYHWKCSLVSLIAPVRRTHFGHNDKGQQ